MNKKILVLIAGYMFFSAHCFATVGRVVLLKNNVGIPVSVRYVKKSTKRWKSFEEVKTLLLENDTIQLLFPEGFTSREWIAVDGPGGELIGTVKTDKKCVDSTALQECTALTTVIINIEGLITK